MIWNNALKHRIATELHGYNVYFSATEVPPEVAFPPQWRDFGISDNTRQSLPAEWAEFANLLPWVVEWLDRCVLGTVLAVSDRPYLMYVYSEGDALYFNMGGAPLSFEGASLDDHPYLPPDLKNFYMKLHNGFGFYIGGTMGPSRVEDFVSIADLCDDDYPHLPEMTGVFSSGAGDYLALGAGSAQGEVFIWWHEVPDEPETGIDLWAVMDAWMSAFLETSNAK